MRMQILGVVILCAACGPMEPDLGSIQGAATVVTPERLAGGEPEHETIVIGAAALRPVGADWTLVQAGGEWFARSNATSPSVLLAELPMARGRRITGARAWLRHNVSTAAITARLRCSDASTGEVIPASGVGISVPTPNRQELAIPAVVPVDLLGAERCTVELAGGGAAGAGGRDVFAVALDVERF